MAFDISNTEYFIGQALAGLLAARGDGSPDEKIDGIAERAVKIGRATAAAATTAHKAATHPTPTPKIPVFSKEQD